MSGNKKHLILGCGFLGERLADQFLARGERVFTTTRSPEKAARLTEKGLTIWTGDFGDDHLQAELANELPFQTITICVANDSTDESHETVYARATQLAIQLAKEHETRVRLTSTTGVYAPVKEDAAVVDESSPVNPTRPGARASWLCEKLLRDRLPGQHITFRLAGIYHPDRLPNLAKLKNREPLSGSGDGWLNLIHADDAAAILAWDSVHPAPFDLVNVSDGVPLRRVDFYQSIARHWDCPPPVFAPQQVGRGGQKKIANKRLVQWYPHGFQSSTQW